MKKSTINKIKNICEKNNVIIQWCKGSNKICINNIPTPYSTIKMMTFMKDIRKFMSDEKEIKEAIFEFSQLNIIDTIEQKQMQKAEQIAEKKAEEQAEKSYNKEQRQKEKERKEAEKEAEKERKEAEKEAEKERKEAEKERKEAEKEAIKNELQKIKQQLKLDEEAKKKAEIEKRKHMNDDKEWNRFMTFDDKGNIEKTKNNCYNYFKYCNIYGKNLKYDEWSQLETYNDQIIEPHILTQMSLESERAINQNSELWIEQVTRCICHEQAYNPFKEAFNELCWDGEERAARFFIDTIGADDNKLNRNITTKWLYAWIKRTLEPGCKFDHMLIAYDETHGTGKTSVICRLLESLLPDKQENGCISLEELGFDKDTVQCLNKASIAYVDELAKFLKEDEETVKKFITQTNDNARLAYGKFNKNFQRHCVFYGSTNTKNFIKDNTDNHERRWWILECHGVRHESKKWWDEHFPDEYYRQVIAEIYYLYLSNKEFEFNELDEDDIETLTKVQAGHHNSSKDDILINKLETIMNFKYEDPEGFETYYEWKNAVISKWESYKRGENNEKNDKNISETIEFFGEKLPKNDAFFYKKMSKIPKIWVRQFIQEELGRSINDDNYISRLIFNFNYSSWTVNKNGYYNSIRGIYEVVG